MSEEVRSGPKMTVTKATKWRWKQGHVTVSFDETANSPAYEVLIDPYGGNPAQAIRLCPSDADDFADVISKAINDVKRASAPQGVPRSGR